MAHYPPFYGDNAEFTDAEDREDIQEMDDCDNCGDCALCLEYEAWAKARREADNGIPF